MRVRAVAGRAAAAEDPVERPDDAPPRTWYVVAEVSREAAATKTSAIARSDARSFGRSRPPHRVRGDHSSGEDGGGGSYARRFDFRRDDSKERGGAGRFTRGRWTTREGSERPAGRRGRDDDDDDDDEEDGEDRANERPSPRRRPRRSGRTSATGLTSTTGPRTPRLTRFEGDGSSAGTPRGRRPRDLPRASADRRARTARSARTATSAPNTYRALTPTGTATRRSAPRRRPRRRLSPWRRRRRRGLREIEADRERRRRAEEESELRRRAREMAEKKRHRKEEEDERRKRVEAAAAAGWATGGARGRRASGSDRASTFAAGATSSSDGAVVRSDRLDFRRPDRAFDARARGDPPRRRRPAELWRAHGRGVRAVAGRIARRLGRALSTNRAPVAEHLRL